MFISSPDIPWQDNWPIYRQLWESGQRLPGAERDLSDPTDRVLTARWRDTKSNEIVLVSTELDPDPLISIDGLAQRGRIKIQIGGRERWQSFRQDRSYACDILGYGDVLDTFEFGVGIPQIKAEVVNGVQTYAGPREVLELIGRIPGAVVETFLELSGGWVKDPRGYWVKEIPNTVVLYGLWIEDKSCTPVEYEQLSSVYRSYARVIEGGSHFIYYNGPEPLDTQTRPQYVETAFNRYVLRCLEEATAEFERRTGRVFSQRRIYREIHRGLYRQQQISVKHSPVRVDEYFRLDAFTRSRDVWRRYTESDVLPDNGFYNSSQTLTLEPDSGTLTLNQNFWDWGDWRQDIAVFGIDNLAYLPKGENNLEITYTGGYSSPPVDVAEAVANMAAIRQAIFWQQAITQGMQGISIGCVNLNFGQLFNTWIPSWQSAADRIIESYQRIDVEAW